MKRLAISLVAAFVVLSLGAVSPRGQVLANLDRSASNHYAYPYPADAALPALTAAPAGYEAFHIEHYGRHGSRWLTNGKYYERPVDALRQARHDRQLTLQGERLLRQMERVLNASRDRVGDLTDVGAEQHRLIARRMFGNFPTVFSGDARVDARSTVVLRCILSMQNETMVLRQLNPRLRITTDASYHDMPYMGWGYGEDTLANHIREAQRPLTDSLYATLLHPERFMHQIVADSAYAASIDGRQLMRDVFDIGGSLQGMRQFDDMSLYHLFTNDEIFLLWRLKNIYWYVNWANSPTNGNRMPYIERALLQNIIASADTAIAGGARGANLRFGHETCLGPLACLMELDSANYSCDDLDNLHEHWQDYNIFPKACNIQVVFYRPVGSQAVDAADVLVKVLYNEHEALLPVPAAIGPYCRWTDLRDYYRSKLAIPTDWSAP